MGRPIDGAQATSRTQSVCPSSLSSIIQLSPSSLQTLTELSPPPVTSLLQVEGTDRELPWNKKIINNNNNNNNNQSYIN